MPLVERKTESKTSNYGTVRATRTLYVPPGSLKPGDKVVEPTKRQLAELAAMYPAEFGAAAKAAGVAVPTAPDADESHDVDETAFSEAQEQFLALSQKKALAFIKATTDVDDLGELLDAENRREGGARKAIVNAFHAKGVGAE
jgi:hypothetical protein